MLKSRIKYLMIFVFIFFVECMIAIFFKHGFIRENIGDVLVIPCIYFLLRIVFTTKYKKLSLFVLIFAIIVEILQLFNITTYLAFNNRILSIIFGGTFDVKDIFCYIVGYFLVFMFDRRNL